MSGTSASIGKEDQMELEPGPDMPRWLVIVLVVIVLALPLAYALYGGK